MMLVLTRRLDEKLLIDKGQIVIKVLSIKGKTVALGIKAPPAVDVDREELFIRKQNNPNFNKHI